MNLLGERKHEYFPEAFSTPRELSVLQTLCGTLYKFPMQDLFYNSNGLRLNFRDLLWERHFDKVLSWQ